jgi:hypothetical protein
MSIVISLTRMAVPSVTSFERDLVIWAPNFLWNVIPKEPQGTPKFWGQRICAHPM